MPTATYEGYDLHSTSRSKNFNTSHGRSPKTNFDTNSGVDVRALCSPLEKALRKMASKKGTGKVGRSSISGKFVTVKYAQSHPKTTEVERNKGGGKRK